MWHQGCLRSHSLLWSHTHGALKSLKKNHADSGHCSCLRVQKLWLSCAFCYYSCWEDCFISFFKLVREKWVVIVLKITWRKIRNQITSVTNENSILYLFTENSPSRIGKTSQAWKAASLSGEMPWGRTHDGTELWDNTPLTQHNMLLYRKLKNFGLAEKLGDVTELQSCLAACLTRLKMVLPDQLLQMCNSLTWFSQLRVVVNGEDFFPKPSTLIFYKETKITCSRECRNTRML